MAGELPKNLGVSPKLRGEDVVTVQAEARDLVELIAGPLRLGENVKVALSKVAHVTGIGARRVRAIWHREARRIDAVELDCLRRAAADERIRKDAQDAFGAHLRRLEAADQAFRLPLPHLGRGADAAVLGVAGAADRALDRGARR